MARFRDLTRYSGQFLKNVFLRDKLEFLILFTTSDCNCRCEMCFYWRELNKPDDLSTGEMEKISRSIGKFRTLLLSGGEPFLRKDLYDVCRFFIENNAISALAVPTNGTFPEETAGFCGRILDEYPRLTLSVAVSMDGPGELHDSMRGVEGVFDKASATLIRLSELKKRHSKLELAVNTVITNRNIGQLKSFMDFVFEKFDIDYHDFELLRGDYKNRDLALPALESIQRAHALIVENRKRCLGRRKANPLESFANISLLNFSQALKERFLSDKRPLFVCSAGRNIGAIDANGDVRLCELTGPVGNLRDVDYDFYSLWNSKAADDLRKKIRDTRCACTHVCFIKLTASSYFRTIFHLIYNHLTMGHNKPCAISR